MPANTVNFGVALATEYQTLFNTCTIRPDRGVDRLVNSLDASRARYLKVGDALAVPWHVVAVIHNMESSQGFDAHLHNGDPLTARTVQWPNDRPKVGTPPFTWEESALDALTLKRLDRWTDWTVAGTLYQLERYNGFGYRQYHPEVKSPYLWAASNHYTSGKYVKDGVWSPTATSQQCGAAVLLRRMAERGLITLGSHAVPQSTARALDRETPLLRWSSTGILPHAMELQAFLNTFPEIYLKPDGKPGDKTSDAFRKVTGYYLQGDPRGADES
jgi:lysozyme family protein